MVQTPDDPADGAGDLDAIPTSEHCRLAFRHLAECQALWVTGADTSRYRRSCPSTYLSFDGSSMLLWLSNRRWGRLAGSEPVLVSGGEVVVVVSAVFECGDAAGVGSDGLGGLGQGDAALLASGA